MIRSHSFRASDFDSSWYKRWATELLQNKSHLEGHELHANKFWQNAVMAQVLWEKGVLTAGKCGVGFGVGQERLPALFAKLGVRVTATDQDFTAQEAGHWAEHELATGAQSLNRLGICSPARFRELVGYEPVDMTKIPRHLDGMYDFVWSNCALGHLGSIPAGLKFIEQSLRCLKPGGWAVHTTELNILSDDETVTSGDTVIFRARDIYKLQRTLLKKGYTVSPFRLTLGSRPEDKRVSLAPRFGNDYSKLQFKGHVLTQIVLIIGKPENSSPKTARSSRLSTLSVDLAHRNNVRKITRYRKRDRTMKRLLASSRSNTGQIHLTPAKARLSVRLPQRSVKTVRLTYKNGSAIPLLGVVTELTAKPLVLATDQPVNRRSKFKAKSWLSDNRPTANLLVKSGSLYEGVDYLEPRQDFAFDVTLDSSGLRKGRYREDFCVVQEAVGWIADTNVKIDINVV